MTHVYAMGLGRRARHLILAVAIAMIALATLAAPAAAFIPPGNTPDGLFSCVGGPVAGHPGSNGQKTAMATGNSMGAWNAHFSSDRIANCP